VPTNRLLGGSIGYYVTGTKGVLGVGRIAATEEEALQRARLLHGEGYRKLKIYSYANGYTYAFNIRVGLVVRKSNPDELPVFRPTGPKCPTGPVS
jgi:hypothetical protein